MKKLQWARLYFSKGFSIIPLQEKNKKPAIESWKDYQTRKPTDEELIKWFGNGSRNNIGIVTGSISGIAVVDLDNEEAIEFAKQHNFPLSPLSKTGKGYHIIYRYRDGIRNFQKRDDLPGIDLRGDGGYVVAPPSIHPSGRKYKWVEGKGLDDLPLADLPEILLTKNPEHKTPLKELYKGVPEGSRNDALTRLIGSLVNDGLSFEECLEFAHLWNTKNSPPETDSKEIERTIRSIFERYHKAKGPDNRIDMTLTRLSDLLKEPEDSVTWQVNGMLPTGGFSILASKPKVGKSTIARDLALCVAQGESFLNRAVCKGPVIYYALEEKKAEVKRHFKDMGATGEENIYIYAGSAPLDALIQIKEITKTLKPVLIIVDPLFRLTRIKDGNDYAQVTQALEPLLRLARDTGTHVLCIHHQTKGDRQGGDSVLGSTAIFSSVDTLMIMKRHEKYRTIQTIQRYGEDLEETTLYFDKETRTISIGKNKQEEDISMLEEDVIEFLSSQSEPVIESVIMDEVEGRTGLKRKALRELVKEGKVKREGKGGKGDPFKYSCSLVPDIYMEQENENPEMAIKPNNHAKNTCSQESTQHDENNKSLEQEFFIDNGEVLDLEHQEVEIVE